MNYLHLFSVENKIDLTNINFKELVTNSKKICKCIFLYEEKIVLLNKKVFFLDINALKNLTNLDKKVIILGKKNQLFYVGMQISKRKLFELEDRAKLSFLGIREFLKTTDNKYTSFITSFYSLARWHNNNRFCSFCGDKNFSSDLGNSLLCSNKKCRKKIFPRIDPTIILLLRCKNKILLARSKEWKKNLFSCIAGFCEPSESLEETVKRECFEEIGIKVKNIKYKFSQFWPFTNNLMIGYEGVSKSYNLKINKSEIEEAIWVSRKELLKLQKEKKIILPKKYAIAFCLIEDWLNK